MASSDYVLAQGLRDTRGTYEAWQQAHWRVLRGWMALSFAIACALLAATWLVANLSVPDISRVTMPGVTRPIDLGDLRLILLRNGTVLAFHATACVAGFIAGASMPIAAESRTGFSRWVHLKAGELALAFVVGVTLFSLTIQALTLGFQASTLAYHLDIGNGALILSALPQALIELPALFLPLAAWILASRRKEWNHLLAATFVTVAIAVPMLLVASAVELFVWPHILIALSPSA
jgi:4-amino-4-deoxy-L-arabinose transferase-like glycosyltransferase